MIGSLQDIPATFWGVLAGSLFTLFGVWFTNRAQMQRLARQLEHERALKSEERQLALKRDVYLPAAEAIATGVALIGRLSQLSIPHAQLTDEWLVRSPAIARANLVAGEATLKHLTRFHTSLATKLVALFSVRLRLTLQASERESIMEEVRGLLAENDRFLQERKSVEPDERGRLEFQHKSAEFDRRGRRVTELLERHGRLNNALFNEELRFTELCTEAAMDLNDLVTPVIASARDELGLPFDADAYARVTREARQTATESMQAFLEDLRQLAANMDLSGTANENSGMPATSGLAAPADPS